MKKIGLLLILTMAVMQLKAETICAIVKIEIRQELSFERQAFDAKMVITNGLDIASLENLDIDVLFEDIDGNPVLASSDPSNTNAKFFIRVDSMSGVNDVNGSGVISAGQVAEIHWLIIPAPGTGGLTPSGLRYGVGATVNYTYGEESQTVNVVPDFITVTPTPLLKLDYFLPADVFGDNPLTTEVEPIEPFDLGLRISNTGAGFADDLKIESAQPKIIENLQGLLIDFELLGTSVNDSAVTNSLLAYIGRLEAGEAAMVSWLMQSSLNGEFISFEADFVHSDELGGELTSLIDSPIDTHILFHRVKVDYSGRDQIRDFLAYDQDILRVYESNGGQEQVIDESASVAVSNLGVVNGKQKYQVNYTAVAGASFARWSDPYNGVRQEVTAFRSDGKLLASSNIWQYRIETNPGIFEFYFGLFDVESTGQYEIIVNGAEPNVAPIITVVSPQNGEVGTQLLFSIDVTDANPSDTLSLVSIGAPAASSVVFVSGSSWQFSWLPQTGDVGTYNFILSATDQIETITEQVQLIIAPAGFVDSDSDGMDDAWEQTHFGDLDETAQGDVDQDSATNLQEFTFGGDPNVEDRPYAPQVVTPNSGNLVTTSIDDFVVINSQSAIEADIVYQFELYKGQLSSTALAVASINETNVQTSWTHGMTLVEDETYLWRVRAFDGITPSVWSYDSFTYSSINNPPENCRLDYPINAQVVSSNTPELAIIAANDADSSVLQYSFQVYSDVAMTDELSNSGWMNAELVTDSNGLVAHWKPFNYFHDVTNYFWKASVKDELTTVDCGAGEFSLNFANTTPHGYVVLNPMLDQLIQTNVDLTVSHDNTVTNAANYNYYFEIDTDQSFISANLQQSAVMAIGANTQLSWVLAGLQNDTQYYWRVKALDGVMVGKWKYASFRTKLAIEPIVINSINPSHESWVESNTPVLKLNLDRRIKNLDHYVIEIYSDVAASVLVESQNTSNPIWTASQLNDRTYYYWKAKVVYTDASSSDYTSLHKFFVIDDQTNEAPSFNFVSLTDAEENSSDVYKIKWQDSDNDSNATIELYFDDDNLGSDGTLIAAGISEDDLSDSYNWNISALSNGNYYLYAIITDEQTSITIYSNNSLEVKHHEVLAIASGSSTDETGSSVVINIALNKAPTDYVMVNMYNSDSSEGMLEKQRVIFTPSNWTNIQQTLVTGVDDADLDGDQTYEISFSLAQSSDMNYANVNVPVISLTNIDDEVPVLNLDIKMDKNLLTAAPYSLGDNLTYQLIVSNLGSDNATNVTVLDTMTNLTLISAQDGDCLPLNQFPCVIASIPANSSKTINVIAEINANGIFDNSASAVINEEDINNENNSDTADNGGITEGLNPDIGLVLSECGTQYGQNQPVKHEIIVKNFGDVFVPNANFVSSFSQNIDTIIWTCEASGGASCPNANGLGNIDETLDLQINSFMKFTVTGYINGAPNDLVTANFSLILPSANIDIDNSNNEISISHTINAVMFEDGFETSSSMCN